NSLLSLRTGPRTPCVRRAPDSVSASDWARVALRSATTATVLSMLKPLGWTVVVPIEAAARPVVKTLRRILATFRENSARLCRHGVAPEGSWDAGPVPARGQN